MIDFTERVREESPQDSTYQKLVELVKDGTTRRYFTGGKLYVP